MYKSMAATQQSLKVCNKGRILDLVNTKALLLFVQWVNQLSHRCVEDHSAVQEYNVFALQDEIYPLYISITHLDTGLLVAVYGSTGAGLCR